MPASQAQIPTDRASRYLTQLCKHTSQLSTTHAHSHGHSGAGSMPQHAEWSDTDGVIDFGSGRCTLHATSERLVLNAQAHDQQKLNRIQDALTARLEQIGRHDQLTVTWQQTPTEAEMPSPPKKHISAAAIQPGSSNTRGPLSPGV